ncbi:S8 family peptidase [Bacillus massiliigorillae]|uniref:S8 family peptidase n=1 Tax=Bacillus massiliigorillae TaxID=1243664 RepID=UPI000399DC7D|nr:S8 family serine peptidase [Bacillus massiliigorillae]
MKKGLKVFAAIGLSSMLLASMAIPSASLASTKTALENVKKSSVKKSLKGNQEKKVPMSEDSFIIKYNKALTATEHKAAGGTLVRQVAKLNYAEIKVKNKQNLAKVMKAYQKLGKVESVRPSMLFTTSSLGDPKASEQYQHAMLRTEQALQLTGKNKVIVAVIDTGTDSKHPDLKNVVLPGYNAANPANQNIAQDIDHGTHVSGIIAAEKGNGIGGYGINPNAKILPIDVFDGGWGASDVSIADAILYAVEKGAKVINMSLSGPGTTPILEDAVSKAIESGVVVVAAAGNSGSDEVEYPAAYEGVISVGSINKKKELSSYSNFGPSVDVVAPGEDVYSTLYNYEKKSTFISASGTSMASPVVAGVASLLLAKYPNLTPAQVEYILEKTADDLGEKGFDTKYANGLVNPVKALSYNVKDMPSYVKNEWTHKEIQLQAEQVDATEKVIKEGAITKPYEQKWIQLEVKKGEYIQTVLEGSKMYDYKIMGHFFGGNNKVESFDVNDSQEGTVEGKLIQAPFDGTLAIGVKDVNGSFDDSVNQASKYKLTVEKVAELPKDESSVEKMIDISSLPYQSGKSFTLAGEKGDYDYFTLKVQEEQLVKLNMSGIPGLNTEISVYNASNLVDGDSSEQPSELEKLARLKEALEGEEKLPADFTGNSYGVGKGESVTFTAQPNQEYIIKLAGDAVNMNEIDLLFAQIFGIDLSLPDEEKPSSLIPYSLNVTSKMLPADEDGLDSSVLGEENQNHSVTIIISNAAKKNNSIRAAEDNYFEEANTKVNTILEKALPYTIGDKAKGYIQNEMDQDYFFVEPEETAIYQFGLKNYDGNIPFADIIEVSEEKGEDGKTYLIPNYISDNIDWSGFDRSGMEQFYTGMEKGKKYLVKLAPNAEQGISFEPYELTSKKIITDPSDAYEPSDYKNIKNLPAATFQGNFAMPNDSDIFYYQAPDTGIKAISVTAEKATEAMKQQYPQELLSDFEGFASVVEDKNGNRVFDEGDEVVAYIEKGPSGFSSGSFKVKQGQGYLIEIYGYTTGNIPLTLLPYTFKLESMNKQDEVSSQLKPIKMKQENGALQTATGYLNAGINGGDIDWYQFEVSKDSTVTVKLEAGKEIDGVLGIYQNGKLIQNSDLYHLGDDEVIQLNLEKGKYQVKVNDAYGTASISPYTLKVTTP